MPAALFLLPAWYLLRINAFSSRFQFLEMRSCSQSPTRLGFHELLSELGNEVQFSFSGNKANDLYFQDALCCGASTLEGQPPLWMVGIPLAAHGSKLVVEDTGSVWLGPAAGLTFSCHAVVT